jgi:hypothetical protein
LTWNTFVTRLFGTIKAINDGAAAREAGAPKIGFPEPFQAVSSCPVLDAKIFPFARRANQH